MKEKKPAEIAIIVLLAAVCAFLILRLVVRVAAVNAGPSRSMAVNPLPVAHRERVVDVLAPMPRAVPDTPVLNLALFDQIQAHTLTAPDRDPFSFAPTPQQLQQIAQARAAQEARQTGPPPPPPVPLKALGYLQDAQGKFQAYLSDSENIYAVREGEQFDKVYRVLKITPAFVEVEDASLNLRAQLAIPQ